MSIVYEILRKKRMGYTLSDQEVSFMVKGYYEGDIPDYQMSAFLTSVAIHGMDSNELFAFTKSMVDTGLIMDFSNVNGLKIDKHSTGGVGDTVSLIVIPILACLGYKVPKLSGRALGHTGGTIDKLESIPNMRTNLEINEMTNALESVGAFICQPLNLAPADKKIYALRDVTANVESIPLIASSIMSKKIAANSDVIILDVKVGNGAFMSEYKEALELAKTMLSIAKNFNKVSSAVITDMNEPLNRYIGNYIEVISAIDFLKGNYKKYPRLRNVCFNIINVANYIYNNYDSLRLDSDLRELSLTNDFEYIENIINTGKALEKFAEIIQNQNGDVSIIDDPYRYFYPKIEYSVYSNFDGYIYFDTYLIGLAAGELGLSRKNLGDIVDNNSGIIIEKYSGEFVKTGELVMKLFARDKQSLDNALKILDNALKFSPEPVKNDDIYTILIF